ncbi:MAG: glucosaminidase domain-containing protein [Bacilli bacterium]
MKPSVLIRASMASILTLGFASSLYYYNELNNKNEIVLAQELYNPTVYKEEVVDLDLTSEEETIQEIVPERIEVYDNLTMEELTEKLNRTLSSDLSGKGEIFAKYSIELGVDPYLAVAIAMHETGCTWDCSYLAKTCNNVGGQKGTGCGEYQAFDTLEDGIYGFILNIKNKYVDYGLMTAEEMNPKYAEDPNWSSKVNKYIEKIKNN